MSMTREEAIELLRDTPIDIRSTREDDIHTLYATAQMMAIDALRPVSREQVDVVINSLKLRLENNEEGGVVYIPKFAVRGMIERLEAIENG